MRKNGKKWGKWGFKKIFCSFLVLVMISTQCTQSFGADAKDVSGTTKAGLISEETDQIKNENTEESSQASTDTEQRENTQTGERITEIEENVSEADESADAEDDFDDEEAENSEEEANVQIDESAEVTVAALDPTDDDEDRKVTAYGLNLDGSVTISAENFPDATFRDHVGVFDTNPRDGILSQIEREAVTIIDLGGRDTPNTEGDGMTVTNRHSCQSLTGIEYFPNLKELYIAVGELRTLDLRQNLALERVDCHNNDLTSVNISGLQNLVLFQAYYNQIEAPVDVSSSTRLELLDVGKNRLTTLDVTHNLALKFLYCYDNQLTTLDLHNQGALEQLYAWGNRITSFSAPYGNQFEYLDLAENQLTDLNISQCTGLKKIYCAQNQLTGIDLRNFTELEVLSAFQNRLTSIDVSQNLQLGHLDVGDNQLTELNISNNVKLHTVYCYKNQLRNVDLSKLADLKLFSAFINQLQSIDVTNNPLLEHFDVGDNQLRSVDVTHNTGLLAFYCYKNQLKELDVANNSNLSILHCEQNQLTWINTTNLTMLTEYVEHSQNLGTLSMYYDETKRVWVNTASGEGDIARSFASGTSFAAATIDDNGYAQKGAALNPNEFALDESGYLKIAEQTSVSPEYIYFETPLANGKILSGSFQYHKSGFTVPAATVYMDVNVAKTLNDIQQLRSYFTERTDYEIACESFEQIRNGVVGSYSVTLTYGGASQTAALEVGVKIDYQQSGEYTNFPDEAFRTHVAQFDTNRTGAENGFLTAAELHAVEIIYLGGRDTVNTEGEGLIATNRHSCQDLTGIQYFQNLKELYVQTGKLRTLDLRQNLALEKVDCHNNDLTSVNISGLQNLVSFRAYYNQISTAIDVSASRGLKLLDVGNNQLTSLDLTHNPALEHLWCYKNQLSEIDLSNQSELVRIDAWGNCFASLDLSACLKLEYLDVGDNQLTALDISQNTKLTTIYCYKNQLTAIDLRNLTQLKNFWAFVNQLTSIDVSNNLLLELLDVGDNQLTELNISNNVKLHTVYCYKNQLRNVDLSKLADLKLFSAYINQLQSIDVTNNPLLEHFDVGDNQLRSVDVTHNTGLLVFYCYKNQLKELDVANNSNLSILHCEQNMLTWINTANMPDLTDYLGDRQTLGTLSMQYDETETRWINVSKDQDNAARVFSSGTTFAVATFSDSGDLQKGTPLDENDFSLNDAGYLTIAEQATVNPEYVYFEITLADGKIVNGSFQYEKSGIKISKGYMDVNAAAQLRNEQELLKYFTGRTDYQINCENFADIQSGKVGAYPVLIAFGGASQPATLEVGVSINQSNFPSQAFRSYVKKFDVNDEQVTIDAEDSTEIGFLTAAEIADVTNIDVTSAACGNLTGLRFFTELLSLKCTGNQLSELDIRANTKLQTLYCGHNQLTALDLGHNTALTDLSCDANQLTSLNVSMLENLRKLSCDGNMLSVLDLTGLEQLNSVQAYDQSIEMLTLTYGADTKKWKDTAGSRSFPASGTAFQSGSSAGAARSGFAVDTDGKITTTEILPKETIYFASNLTDGKGTTWNRVLTGTFSYDFSYNLTAKSAFYTGTEIAEQSLTAVEDLKQLQGLISTSPETEELKEAVEISLTGGTFEDFKAGKEGTYTYEAGLLDQKRTGNQLKLLPDGAVINSDRSAYLWAKGFTLGMSGLESFHESKAIERAAAVYETVLGVKDTESSAFEIDAAQLQEIKRGTAGSSYDLTITHRSSQMKVTVKVTVMNDAPTELIEIPARIVLGRKSQNEAGAEGTVKRLTTEGLITTGTVEVYADDEVTLNTAGNTHSLTVNVYDKDGNAYSTGDPLAALSSTKPEESFRLQGNVENLAYGSYAGTMNFTIRYREEE